MGWGVVGSAKAHGRCTNGQDVMAQGGQTRGKDAPLVKCSVITIRQAPKAKEYSKHMVHTV
jgi:hypothetical protein